MTRDRWVALPLLHSDIFQDTGCGVKPVDGVVPIISHPPYISPSFFLSFFLSQLGLGDTFIDMHSMESAPRRVDSEELEGKTVVRPPLILYSNAMPWSLLMIVY